MTLARLRRRYQRTRRYDAGSLRLCGGYRNTADLRCRARAMDACERGGRWTP